MIDALLVRAPVVECLGLKAFVVDEEALCTCGLDLIPFIVADADVDFIASIVQDTVAREAIIDIIDPLPAATVWVVLEAAFKHFRAPAAAIRLRHDSHLRLGRSWYLVHLFPCISSDWRSVLSRSGLSVEALPLWCP